MRRVLLAAAVAGAGVAGSAGAARAEGDHTFGPVTIFDFHQWQGPKTTSVTWPSAMPPGWYSNTYRHQWYQPWYAYYNFSSGPYANWMAGGGYAGYSYHGPAGYYRYDKQPTEPYLGAWFTGEGAQAELGGGTPTSTAATPSTTSPAPATTPQPMPSKDEKPKGGSVSVTLPADAKLLFNGIAANGTGSLRTFQTPPLQPGQSYQYKLTAEVTRDGRTERVTETVIVRAGETARVTLSPSTAVQAAGTK